MAEDVKQSEERRDKFAKLPCLEDLISISRSEKETKKLYISWKRTSRKIISDCYFWLRNKRISYSDMLYIFLTLDPL